jgi:hypothetical protein
MSGDGPLRPVANQVPSFVSYLHDRYQDWLKEKAKELKEGDPPLEATLPGFLEFTNLFLAKNPPANPTYLASGLGVRMANGDYLALGVTQPMPQMRDEGVHITIPQSIPGMHGISDTFGIGITGGR